LSADLAILDAAVCTMDSARPTAAAIALQGGRIVAVGTTDDVRAVCGPRTDIIDGRGRMVLPGFQDAHVHPPMAGVEMVRCNLTGESSREGYLSVIAAYAAARPAGEWVRGGGWAMAAFPGGLPSASDLDSVVGPRPVYLPNRDHHSAWVSSRALELAGITAATPDPSDGRIERDEHGHPTGALHDGAMTLVERLLPPLSASDYAEGILAAQAHLHALGVTAWQDAWVAVGEDGNNPYEAYLGLASAGRLTARVVGAMWWDRHVGIEQVDRLVALRERAAREVDDGRFAATSVKIMQDGVCETFTAAMLTPYLDHEGHPTDNCGLSFVEPEALKGHVTRLDAEGFQVHVHALGDRAVREALDAVEAARTVNGPGGRHHLAHLQVVHPDDLIRFRQLGVVANFQPLWACEDAQMVELTVPFLGPERAAQQYPIGSLARLGVSVAFGSDWPVSSPDPLEELHVAVTRTPPGEGTEVADRPPFLPDERVNLEFGLAAFTRGSAFVNGLEASTGSIEVGKLGDLVVLDRNLFDIDAQDGGIAAGRVVMTLFEGESVYEAPGV
jgi:hypothetical protein